MDEKTVIDELTQGLQMTQQLMGNLHSPNPEARDNLIQNILSSYHNALFVLQSGGSAGQLPNLPEPSLSIGSPGSEEFMSDQPFSGQQEENIIARKRKGPTWEDQVITCIDNDGFSWRKYGQKDILGTKFPRSYYRCSYRNVHNCYATKQVQRKDAESEVFDIKYKGEHTCHHGAQSYSPSPLSLEKHEITPTNHELSPPSPGETLSNLIANLSVNTLDLGCESDTSFCFPSTSSGFMEDFPNFYDDELFQVHSPPFISPVTSESYIVTECRSSQSLDILPDPENVDSDFDFNNSFF